MPLQRQSMDQLYERETTLPASGIEFHTTDARMDLATLSGASPLLESYTLFVCAVLILPRPISMEFFLRTTELVWPDEGILAQSPTGYDTRTLRRHGRMGYAYYQKLRISNPVLESEETPSEETPGSNPSVDRQNDVLVVFL